VNPTAGEAEEAVLADGVMDWSDDEESAPAGTQPRRRRAA